MLDSLYQLASAPNTNASTDLPTSQCVSQHFRSVHFAVAAESPLFTCACIHSLFLPSSLCILSLPHPTFYPPPDDENRIILRPIDGHSDCQRDFINACYVDVCCSPLLVCVLRIYLVCVFYSAYNLQGYKCRNKFIAAQGKIRPTLHYRDVHYS